ncbi:hypothetical protein ANANG_G00196960 [Anguilla anguilla]|uniref:Uncharacterized protein n=1 Tax=Anguilla anguilla TaxID=7936 RepID=A0A9D3M927_ANGAN|nr:hypothetical protein ANANG_G00196960 [Anguilla anguilla]
MGPHLKGGPMVLSVCVCVGGGYRTVLRLSLGASPACTHVTPYWQVTVIKCPSLPPTAGVWCHIEKRCCHTLKIESTSD